MSLRMYVYWRQCAALSDAEAVLVDTLFLQIKQNYFKKLEECYKGDTDSSVLMLCIVKPFKSDTFEKKKKKTVKISPLFVLVIFP